MQMVAMEDSTDQNHLQCDSNCLWMDEMEENQLLINRSGTWIKTNKENIDSWISSITITLKNQGFRLWKSTCNNSIRSLSFYHLSYESLNLQCFDDGHINITAKNIKNLYSSIIPRLETKLNIKFNCWSTDGVKFESHEKYGYREYLDDYLNNRVNFLNLPRSILQKCSEKDKINYMKMRIDREDDKTEPLKEDRSSSMSAIVEDILEDDHLSGKDEDKEEYLNWYFDKYCPQYDDTAENNSLRGFLRERSNETIE